MLLLLLLLTAPETGHAQRVNGIQKADSCQCKVNSSIWDFPFQKFEGVAQLVQNCEDTLQKLQTQVTHTNGKLSEMQAAVENVTARLLPFQYLNFNGLHNPLRLSQLSKELEELDQIISKAHNDNPSTETQKLTEEVDKVQKEVKNMYQDNVFNLDTVREKLRSLNNRAETCRSIPDQFRSTCSQRIMTNISSPVITKLSPYGKSYTSGAWGRETKEGSKDSYWVQALVSGSKSGSVVQMYSSYEDFMASRNPRDESVAPAFSHPNAIQGPGTMIYGEAVFYQCYKTNELCRYDLKTKETLRKKLPDAGYDNTFPYCYYSCHDWTDIDLSADETGLWVIYATTSNHGNLVLSRLDSETLDIIQTWKTRLFKRSVTNAFMVCGVLYATRYIDTYREEVFYAFDTSTGQEDNTLSLPLEKVAAGIANLNYNPIDRRLYMYNNAYLLAYQAIF